MDPPSNLGVELKCDAGPEELGISQKKPISLNFAEMRQRLESFHRWPKNAPVSSQDLAEAGFFYTGEGDKCFCYFCGEGLGHWEEGDNPWLEHAKWYPDCGHVFLNKGPGFIKQATGALAENETDSNSEDSLSDEVSVDYMSAIQEYLRKEITGNQTTASPELTEEEMEALREENQILKEKATCKICRDARASVIFLPCGHMITCPLCAPSQINCLLCSQCIMGTVRAYLSAIPD